MKIAISYLIILMLGCCIACATIESSEQTTPALKGDYQYTASDKNGGKVVEGRLTIISVERVRVGPDETIQIKGNWQLNKVGNQENIGPQVGAGDLDGGIIKGEIYLDLNPNISDSNVNLRGTIEGRRFHGTWSFDGYGGSINKGTFEATRK